MKLWSELNRQIPSIRDHTGLAALCLILSSRWRWYRTSFKLLKHFSDKIRRWICVRQTFLPCDVMRRVRSGYGFHFPSFWFSERAAPCPVSCPIIEFLMKNSGRNLRENHYREKSRESTEMSAGGMESERCWVPVWLIQLLHYCRLAAPRSLLSLYLTGRIFIYQGRAHISVAKVSLYDSSFAPWIKYNLQPS